MVLIDKYLEKELKKQSKYFPNPNKLKALARVTHPLIGWSWYLICFQPYTDDKIIYTLLSGFEVEFGYINIDEINEQKIKDIPFDLDYSFIPTPVSKIYLRIQETISL